MNLDLLNIRLSYQYGIIEYDQYREMMASVRTVESGADVLHLASGDDRCRDRADLTVLPLCEVSDA
jgi:hypothetical protein